MSTYMADVCWSVDVEVELVEVKKALTKKSIEQLGLMKDVNSLVVLSGACILSK